MSYLLTKSSTYELELQVIEKFKIDKITLMLEAGKATWHQFIRYYGSIPKTIAIFLGSGNNAGDGLVFANEALKHGCLVDVIQIEDFKSDLTKSVLKENARLKKHISKTFVNKKYEVVVDAMLGLGFHGSPDKPYELIIQTFNELSGFKLAIDLPSGIDADSGIGQTYCLVDLTVTYFAKKIGHVMAHGKEASNKIIICLKHYLDLKFTLPIVQETSLPDRLAFVHKYQCGEVGVIAGSEGMQGAGWLSAMAALRADAGIVRYYHIIRALTMLDPAIITQSISSDDDLSFLKQNVVYVIGPGLNHTDAKTIMSKSIHKDLQLVIDAGALYALPASYDFNHQCVLTPHIGEAAHLLQKSNEYVLTHPIECALSLYHKYQTYIVLKSSATIFVHEGFVSLIVNGHPSLATAGSGDVLAGMIGGYIARYGISSNTISQAIFNHANIGHQLGIEKKSGIASTDFLE